MKACYDGSGWKRPACAKACKRLAGQLDALTHIARDTCKVALSYDDARSIADKVCTASTCKYKLHRSIRGLGVRGNYAGKGVAMRVFDIGSAQNGSMTMVASIKVGAKVFRFEAFCGAGQCEDFEQKAGPRSQLRFFPDGAVFKTPPATR